MRTEIALAVLVAQNRNILGHSDNLTYGRLGVFMVFDYMDRGSWRTT